MYIQAAFYDVPSPRPVKPVRERYRQYFRDLYKRHELVLDDASLQRGSQYGFHELGYLVLAQCVQYQQLTDVDVLMFAHWTPEFDADYAAYGLHLLHRYQLKCPVFDVGDQGTIAALTALQVIASLQKAKASRKALCLALEQTTVPDTKNAAIKPEITAASGLVLVKQRIENSIKIKAVKIFTDAERSQLNGTIVAWLFKFLHQFNIDTQHCCFYLKENSWLTREFNAWQHHQGQNLFAALHYLPQIHSISGFFHLMHSLLHHKITTKKRYGVYFTEDVESEAAGMVVFEIIAEEFNYVDRN